MNGSRLKLCCTLLLLVTVAGACSQGSASIGDQGTTPAKTGLAAYVANWVGYIEAYKFIDNTDTVRIAIADDGSGTVRFGDRELWAAASDPNAPYPPDIFDAEGPPCPPKAVAWDGFLHLLHSLSLAKDRLRATIASQAVFSTWCSIQHPVAMQSGAYTCFNVPGWVEVVGASCSLGVLDAGSSAGCATYTWTNQQLGQYELSEAPCMQAAFCVDHAENATQPGNALCRCNENSCQLDTVADDIILDVALDATQLSMVGTLLIGGTNYTIRLKRQ